MRSSKKKSTPPGGVFDPERVKNEISEIETETGRPDFWDDREHAEQSLLKLKRLTDRIEPWEEIKQQVDDLWELLNLALEEGDTAVEQEIRSTLHTLQEKYEKLRLLELLNDEHDDASAFLTIHSGAGGTEACDWVSMLMRLYLRWCENKGYKSTIIDLQEAEGGVKSTTIQVDGGYAYGYLKAEGGIHRLVRISPFDSGGRRHTSFASVYVSPVIDDEIEIDVRPEDIRVDTYRASGAGGQHVNKTDSAVRMTHLETGIVVQCQNERSQHKNRDMAMKVLQSRLYEYYRQKQEEERSANAQEKKDIAWGHQIRSYVFQPYTMVKDHRTEMETGNVQAVMDGGIDEFIEEYLRQSRQSAHATAES